MPSWRSCCARTRRSAMRPQGNSAKIWTVSMLPPPGRRKAADEWQWAAAAAVLLLLAGGLAWWKFRPSAASPGGLAGTGNAENAAGAAPKATKDSIILADFINLTGDPVFDTTLNQALQIDLEQSP